VDQEASGANGRAAVELGAVPETLLWTLYHRAAEARRPDAVIHDPWAVELVDALDVPFEQRFGRAPEAIAQWQALRALCFDRVIARFLARNPGASVVALGEGLETQFWRVDDDRVRWLGVDLPETVELRRRVLPPAPRQRLLACSATDERWLDEVDTARPVLVTAQGLLMYLSPDEVHRLIAACASRIPAGLLLFDACSRRLAERSRARRLGAEGGYRPPPWTWGIDAAERRRIRATPGITSLHTLRLPRGRGPLLRWLLPAAAVVPLLRRALLSVELARIGPPAQKTG
jgi:O-methyltransferase involved in polyketide biosynthesis